MKQLKPQDAQFLYMETENNLSNATMLCIYAPPAEADFDAVAAVFQQLDERLHLSPIFTHHLKHLPINLDYPYWVVDPYFRLRNHLFHVPTPVPGDRGALAAIMADIHSRPMDLRRPPWEVHIVTGLDDLSEYPKGSFALIVKMHHAAIDGISAMRFFQALHDAAPGDSPDTAPPPAPYSAPAQRQMLANAGRNYLLAPVQALGSIYRQLSGMRRQSSTKASSERKTPVPKTRFNGAVGPQKNFAAMRFALAELKLLRALADGATLNDVILAICGGALHRYLQHHGELPNIPLVAWVPINARRAGDENADGNNISAMAIRVGSQIADPVERLQKICLETRDAKEAKSGLAARMLTDLSQHMPSTGMAAMTRLLLASNMTAKMCNLAVSNVPGPQQPLYLRGAQCHEQYGMVPLGEGMGLFVVAMSYNGYVSLSITSTEEILPDIALLANCLQEEFQSMCKNLEA